MKFKYRDHGFGGNGKGRPGLWNRMKEQTAHLLACGAIAATLAGTPACGDAFRLENPQGKDATSQTDGGINDDSGHTDAHVDAGRPDASPEVLPWNQNLIGDYLNRSGGDRVPNSDPADPRQAYPLGVPDTQQDANPMTDGVGGNIGIGEMFMKGVGSADATMFPDVTWTMESGDSYTLTQALWVSGDNHFDSDIGDVVGNARFIAHSIKIDGPGAMHTGVPVCKEEVGGFGDYNWCMTQLYQPLVTSASERLTINLLGQEYVITELNPPAVLDVDNEDRLRAGGSLKIAKEVSYARLTPGQSMGVGGAQMYLEEVQVAVPTPQAVITVINGAHIEITRLGIPCTKSIHIM
jgi:hypothetical protein